MFTVRELTAADRSAFRELRQIALTSNPDDFLLTADEERSIPRLAIEAALDEPNPASFFLGAFAGDPFQIDFERPALIGIAGLITTSLRKGRHRGALTSVFVHPDHRRQRIARTLVEQILSRASDAGLTSVRLECVAENRAAIGLYEALDFVTYGREPGAYKLGNREWDVALMIWIAAMLRRNS